jgi:hypothetical protein
MEQKLSCFFIIPFNDFHVLSSFLTYIIFLIHLKRSIIGWCQEKNGEKV